MTDLGVISKATLTAEQVFNLVSGATMIPRRRLKEETKITSMLLPDVRMALERHLGVQMELSNPLTIGDLLLHLSIPIAKKGKGRNGRNK
jgi:hypothetical protein